MGRFYLEVVLLLLPMFITVSPAAKLWGDERSNFSMTRFMPLATRRMVAKVGDPSEKAKFYYMVEQLREERHNSNLSSHILMEGRYSIFGHLMLKVNNTPWQAPFLAAMNEVFKPVINSEKTFAKTYAFADELLEAYVYHDCYHISLALFYYLHLREGLGVARLKVREMFPNCEKLANVPEVHEFYLKHKGEKPTSRRVLKDFLELLEWLDFEGGLEHIQ
ncbi:hypothetical protein L596_025057 [Steinernema carpocapsae]|uniref:Uncharacterized protein n=1 Tax=Steinernema carpocapsae TaxID=34508 RepID=A0A4V5ZYP7_STECR|nr:hypothetical protein L596_025057 [Steinernema carpocapsae]